MNPDNLKRIKVEVRAELGRGWKEVGDLAEMGEGSLIVLDKLAGEAIDVLANGKLIARGEVVIIDENFGVRVTEVVIGEER